MARLKVFRGNHDGNNYMLVATTSIPKAMALLGLTHKGRFAKYFSVLENDQDCELALASPEVVFTKPIIFEYGVNNPWVKLK
jgi:hypothetical protein